MGQGISSISFSPLPKFPFWGERLPFFISFECLGCFDPISMSVRFWKVMVLSTDDDEVIEMSSIWQEQDEEMWSAK